ncbi:MAG: hypothetical protein HY706_11905 [Candidatus Hydrogenedentes bacterium]|nr:hypothetical protein [Candidatus Hydrogenedentota bacterium]
MCYANENRIWSAVTCVAVFGGLFTAAYAQEVPSASQPPSPDATEQTAAAENEVLTMAKVMEDSINQSGLKDWQAPFADLNLFEPLTKAQYIPTVGAVFTIRVNFCIVEPETPQEQPETPKGDEDLWEKHSGPVQISESSMALDSMGRKGVIVTDKGRRIVVGTNSVTGTGGDKGIMTSSAVSPDRGFDADKVQKLRQAIVGALAKYAYRIEHVKESERILVVVEAPKCGAPVTSQESKLEELGQLEVLQRRAGVRGGGGFGGGAGGGGGFGGAFGIGGGGFGGGFSVKGGKPVSFGFSWAAAEGKDCLLLAVNKADVASALTPEQMEGKVQEVRY